MKKLFFLLIIVFLSSCDKDLVFRETIKDFPDNRWTGNDVKTIDVTLEEDVALAEIRLLFSHVFEPQYTTVPLLVSIIGPSVSETIAVDLSLNDATGKSLSECAGDVCDLHITIKDNLKLPKGDYKVTVQHKYDFAYLPNVLALGISVREHSK